MANVTGDNATLSTTATTNCTGVLHPYAGMITQMEKYSSLPFIALGIPGNILAFFVWIRPNMRNSSGVYMALLAINQAVFLVCRATYGVDVNWQIPIYHHAIVCEFFVVLYYFLQYLDPLFYLAFTVDRYISVCHPFRRRQLCTIKRAIKVSIVLVCVSLTMSSPFGYFFAYNDLYGYTMRVGLSVKIWEIYSYITETIFFLFIPLTVLVLNMCVIRAIKMSRARILKQGSTISNEREREKVEANSKVLLYVSFYFIFSVLPVSVMFLTQYAFYVDDYCVVQEEDAKWNAYYIHSFIKHIVDDVGLLHYSINFYIYVVIGKAFRYEFYKMIRRS